MSFSAAFSFSQFPISYMLLLWSADSGVEERLRDLGFGYRARFLQQSAKQILDTHGPQWLVGLRNVPYLEARDSLRTLPGVGTKVRQNANMLDPYILLILIWRADVKTWSNNSIFCRWQTVFVWCVWISVRPFLWTHMFGRSLSGTISTLLITDKRPSQKKFTEI